MSRSVLPDIVRPDLQLIFVGINPGRHSARARHHYAGPGNHFWPLLFESGLVPEPLTFEEDHRLPLFGIGLLNIVDRTTPGSDGLSAPELRSGARRLLEKLEQLRPRMVCFNGRLVYRTLLRLPREESGMAGAENAPLFEDGIQSARPAGIPAFVMPSTSPRAVFPRTYRLALFRRLKAGLETVPNP